MSDQPRSGDADDAPAPDDPLFDSLTRAAALVTSRLFPEAEAEALRALAVAPSDVRALKLLALVRFKLGRLEEARSACRQILAVVPRDAATRLNLGLIALRLERVDEAVEELTLAARLAPHDTKAWSYLGHAHLQRGERSAASAAFRRAGDGAMASELERSALTQASALDQDEYREDTGSSAFGDPPAEPSAFAYPAGGQVEVAGSRGDSAHAQAWVSLGSVARLAFDGEMIVQQDAVAACSGSARMERARRRRRGRVTDEWLGSDARRFVRLDLQGHGRGDALPDGGTRAPRGDVHLSVGGGLLVRVTLDGEVLFVREDRIVAFDGALSWECGHVPQAERALEVLQLRGPGQAVFSARSGPLALGVSARRPLLVAIERLIGWTGGVVVSGPPARDELVAEWGVVCEGEGVVFVDGGGKESGS